MSIESFTAPYVSILENTGVSAPKPLPHMKLYEMIEHIESLLRAGNFTDGTLVEIVNFVGNVKRSLRLRKISANDLGMSQSAIVRDVLGLYVAEIPKFYSEREHYLPFMMLGESPYHKISHDENGEIQFSYERNTPVIALPVVDGAIEPGRPSAIEMILWEIRRDSRKKYVSRIEKSSFYKNLTGIRQATST